LEVQQDIDNIPPLGGVSLPVEIDLGKVFNKGDCELDVGEGVEPTEP